MAGRLAVDFGTSNTVVALWDAAGNRGITPTLAGLSVERRHIEGGRQSSFHVVPSLIHYEGHRVRVGRQIADDGLEGASSTFRWMKSYVGHGTRIKRQVGEGRQVDPFQAARDFLTQVLLAAGDLVDLAEEEVAFTVPVEAFEHYQDWLDGVARDSGISTVRLIDEPSAAALGYQAQVRPGEAFLLFDFGGGTADVAVLKVEENAQGGRRCRVLGKAGAQVGGSAIDGWILRDLLTRAGRTEGDVRHYSGHLLTQIEKIKEALSFEDERELRVMDPETGTTIVHRYTRSAFEDLLESNGLYAKLSTLLDLAEAQAREQGYDRDRLVTCLMTGGSSLIPSVRRLLRTRYGERARADRPFDAVALGAAAYVAGVDFDDRIRHDYAIRHYDRAKGDYGYRTVVASGTPYPGPVMHPSKVGEPLVLTIKASNEQQTRLGLQIFEVARRESVAVGGGGFDLVFDASGAARYSEREDVDDATHRAMGSATFVQADPPAKMGEPRFVATFEVDTKKRLCITVKDVLVGKTLMRSFPMVKLT